MKRFFFPEVFIVVILFGCGYQFSGHGELAGDIRRIHLTAFDNQTMETGLETWIVNDIADELLKKNTVRLTTKANSEATVKGRVIFFEDRTITRQNRLTPTERSLGVAISIRLVRTGGQVIWKAEDVRAYETYRIFTDAAQTRNSRNEAIRRLTDRLAEEVFLRMTVAEKKGEKIREVDPY